MDIDVSALRSLVVQRDLSLDVVVASIEEALLVAYRHTPHAAERARVELDRSTGHVVVWAAEVDESGHVVGEYDDTPADFGRVAATTARQVLRQRLLEVTDAATVDQFSAKVGELVSGPIQQGRDRSRIQVDLGGGIEGTIPPGEQVRARTTPTGGASRPLSPRSSAVPRGPSSRCPAAIRTWSGASSPSRCPRSPTASSRSRPAPASPARRFQHPSRSLDLRRM